MSRATKVIAKQTIPKKICSYTSGVTPVKQNRWAAVATTRKFCSVHTNSYHKSNIAQHMLAVPKVIRLF